MATNTLVTDVKILKESMRILHNNLGMVKGMNKQYSKEFGISGAKVGATVNVRKPNTYFIRKGPVAQVQGIAEGFVPLTLACQWGFDFSYSSAEATLSMDDFTQRYLAPGLARMSTQMDQDASQAAITGSYVGNNGASVSANAPVYSVVGTPGTTPGTKGGSVAGLLQYNAPDIYLNAGVVLGNHATPDDGTRSCLLSLGAQAQSVGALSGLFNPQGVLSDQYIKGHMGDALGYTFKASQNVYTYSVPTSLASGSPVTTVTAGSNAMTISALTPSTGTIKAGTIFNVATVYEVNPENQMSTGQLQMFVVTADATISGNAASVTVYPTPVVAGTGVSNGTVTAVGATQAVTFLSGTAVGGYQQSLAYHPDAFTLATADLDTPPGVICKRDNYDGISMRILQYFDGGNDTLVCRVDVLGGIANLRPELACRITS